MLILKNTFIHTNFNQLFAMARKVNEGKNLCANSQKL